MKFPSPDLAPISEPPQGPLHTTDRWSQPTRIVEPYYRVVASDLDGTLLGHNGSVSTRSAAAVERVEATGAVFVIATARPLQEAFAIARQLSHSGPIVCQNGAVIYDRLLNNQLERFLLTVSHVRHIVHQARLQYPQATIAVDYLDGRLTDPDWPGLPGTSFELPTLWRLDAKHLPGRRAACVLVCGGWTDAIDFARQLHVNVTSSKVGLVEFSRTGIDKARGLRRICDRRGIDLSSVIAFGDMLNDIPMLRSAGLGVAVANAHEMVKTSAEALTDSNDCDGVAKFLEEFLAAERIGS